MTEISTKKPQIELWPLDKLTPYPGNAKIHPPEQIAGLAKAILEFGWDQPVVVDGDGIIIKGHGRRLAAMRLVEQGHVKFSRVPVIVRSDLTKEQADAARLSDNRVASIDYDTALLQEELKRLAELSVDLETLGFSDKELEFLTSDLGEIDESVLVDDVGAAVEAQKRENAGKAKEIDGKAVPLHEATGFKKIRVETARRLRRFMAKLEDETGKAGEDALEHFLIEAGC